METTAYLSLGSNIGDRYWYLCEAIRLLESPDLTVIRKSGIYETAPRDLESQPWFLNLVIEVRTSLYPRQLLARALKVESRLGRKRTVRFGPRTVDIDILLFGQFVMETPELTIPHPRMCDRRFVLEPLAELAPNLRHPREKLGVRELLAQVAGQTVRRLKEL